MAAPQSFGNHARLDPAFHFFLVPLLLLDIAFAIYATVHHWPQHRALFSWWVVLSVALLVQAFLVRIYALKAQDRVIRLEERLRLSSLLSSSDHPLIHQLTERQLIALRFASDAELPSLARRAANEQLSGKQIKAAIQTWRADHFRI